MKSMHNRLDRLLDRVQTALAVRNTTNTVGIHQPMFTGDPSVLLREYELMLESFSTDELEGCSCDELAQQYFDLCKP